MSKMYVNRSSESVKTAVADWMRKHRVSHQGDTARGWYILRQAVQLGKALGLFERPRRARLGLVREALSSEWKRVCALAAWATFTLNL